MKFKLEQRKKLMILSQERLNKVREARALLDTAQWDYHNAANSLNNMTTQQDESAIHIQSLLNAINTVDNKENITVDLFYNISEFFEKIVFYSKM